MATSPLRIYSLADLSDNHQPKRQMSAIATPWRQSSLAPDLLNEWVVSLISSPASKRASFLTQRKTEEYDISNTLVSVAQAPCCAPKRPNHSNTVPLLITTFCSMPPLVCPKQSVTLPAAKKMSDHRNCSASPTRNKPEKQTQMRMPNGARLSANAATIIAVSSSGGLPVPAVVVASYPTLQTHARQFCTGHEDSFCPKQTEHSHIRCAHCLVHNHQLATQLKTNPALPQ